MVQTNSFCSVVSLFSFKNQVVYIHKVGPKHKFLQCCFNVFFENKVIYTFLSIKLVQNTFCRVFSGLTFLIPYRFLSVFPLPKAPPPKRPKFSFRYLLDLQHANTSDIGARCEIVFGIPPAKADIATAIPTPSTSAKLSLDLETKEIIAFYSKKRSISKLSPFHVTPGLMNPIPCVEMSEVSSLYHCIPSAEPIGKKKHARALSYV